ncbi:hypothetical protein OHT52_21290 [Streptomyces sp. NBC_00247]|uniref:hypothetical protein n=1 Tax=Streptomyces sp. NBC_00247 TaxID=2975689 RepID=UPI002E2CA7B5|nr:hypothetical protein [Streptomyces sp. NBC_00247]
MSADLAAYGGAVVLVGTVAVTWAVRLMHAPTRRAAGSAGFTPPVPGTRYLPCHTTRCAHMTHPHLPHGDGAWRCRQCGNVKGGTQ